MDIIIRHGIKLDQDDINKLENIDPHTLYNCSICTSCNGFTPLMHLVSMVDKYPAICPVIKEYCSKFPDAINKVNERGWHALMIASRNSGYNAVKILLKYGSNPNIQNKVCETALHMAVLRNTDCNYLIVELLLKYGADPNLKCDTMNVLRYVYLHNPNIDFKILRLLLEYDSKLVIYNRVKTLVETILILNIKN